MSIQDLQRGFTLIEMLLVVAIIVVLLSLLLPALGKAKDLARQDVCKTNLSALFQAAVPYSADNARRTPSARGWVNDTKGDTDPGNDDRGWWWFEIEEVRRGDLYSYMGGNENAYVCPTFLETRSWWTTDYSGHNYQTKTPAFTYSLNEYVSGTTNRDTGQREYTWQSISSKPGIKNVGTMTGAQEPDKLAMFTDENGWVNTQYAAVPINNGAMGVGRYKSAQLVDCIGSFHSANGRNYNDGYSNVMFMDGHAALVHVSETKEVVTPKRWKDAE